MAFNGQRYSGGSNLCTGNNAVSSLAKIDCAVGWTEQHSLWLPRGAMLAYRVHNFKNVCMIYRPQWPSCDRQADNV